MMKHESRRKPLYREPSSFSPQWLPWLAVEVWRVTHHFIMTQRLAVGPSRVIGSMFEFLEPRPIKILNGWAHVARPPSMGWLNATTFTCSTGNQSFTAIALNMRMLELICLFYSLQASVILSLLLPALDKLEYLWLCNSLGSRVRIFEVYFFPSIIKVLFFLDQRQGTPNQSWKFYPWFRARIGGLLSHKSPCSASGFLHFLIL